MNSLGGGERLLVATIEAFKEAGWEVTLATVEPTDWELVSRVWGKVVRPDKEITLLPFKVRAFGIYTRQLTTLMISQLKRKHDLVFNTHGDVVVAESDITYMHFPTFVMWGQSYTKYESGFWRLYFTPHYALQKKLIRRHIRALLLTNSRFSKHVIRKAVGKNSIVVHPPVDVRCLNLNGKREDVVVSIGRFSKEKRYEFVLEVAERVPNVEFHICGSLTPANKPYYNMLVNAIEERGLKNVHLHTNIPQKDLEKLLAQAKVYFHAMINEHFGISVVEGMASGLVPVVHKSGGTWTDVVDYGRYGYGYKTVGEAVDCIRNALENYDNLTAVVRERAKHFSKEKYKKRIVRVIEKYCLG